MHLKLKYGTKLPQKGPHQLRMSTTEPKIRKKRAKLRQKRWKVTEINSPKEPASHPKPHNIKIEEDQMLTNRCKKLPQKNYKMLQIPCKQHRNTNTPIKKMKMNTNNSKQSKKL